MDTEKRNTKRKKQKKKQKKQSHLSLFLPFCVLKAQKGGRGEAGGDARTKQSTLKLDKSNIKDTERTRTHTHTHIPNYLLYISIYKTDGGIVTEYG